MNGKKVETIVPDDMRDLGGESGHLFEIERQEDYLAILFAAVILILVLLLVR
ncbi:MAG: hypothetical protein K6T80_01765 [Firmicutes bacterium]|nr:hypothetical protein [Bacillota bacterium]